ncbi:ethanolamine ammonia-lyase subunit EutC [Undibacterium pigrum]|uniref:Ethanolamine ammonia-lyase small subunit n=1 Tax=Undibacterium pigrum TaxID=401470 RepID=A0A318J3Y7_9BURK|nr:ethanolamine ammonia-lyase subunit EutC [Undibacterium pigrum]PXX41401.1 ethanolamine ammonia-lyase light chain [Undibacterium pigrum]
MSAAKPPLHTNPWQALRQFTQARIALGRAGVSLPTGAQLDFQLAHARARDAVHKALDVATLAQALQQAGHESLHVNSAAHDRNTYLQRPDLGRRLNEEARQHLGQLSSPATDLAIVIADGLSAPAVAQNALPFLINLLTMLAPDNWSLAPIVIATQARVAIGDETGALLNASAVLVLIGERPGLSSPDSMGAYLSWAPQPGLTDAARNCISNIRPDGLSYAEAAYKLHYLLTEARKRGLTGIALKDETEAPVQLGKQTMSNFLLKE